MGQIMEALQGMQACKEGVDQADLQQAAQACALELGRQMAEDPALKTTQACLARLPKLPMGQSASPLGQLTFDDEPIDGNPRSICERLR